MESRVGIIGATPQDLSDLSAGDRLRQIFAADGKKAVCYGMGDGLDAVKQAASAEYNLVVSPSAWKRPNIFKNSSEHRMLSVILW